MFDFFPLSLVYQLILICGIGLFLFSISLYQNRRIGKWSFACIFLFLFIGIRSKDFFELFTLNPDEEQWLACANSLVHDPIGYFRYFLLFDYTRFFTILPLAALLKFSGGLSYIHARLLNNFLLIIFLFINKRTVKIFFDDITSWVIFVMFSVFIFITLNADMTAYNSELFVSILFSIFLLQLVKIYKGSKQAACFFIAGISVGCMPFAKEQSILMAFAAGLLAFTGFLRFHNLKSSLYFLVGAILSFSLIFIPVLTMYGWDDVYALLDIGVKYSQQGVKSNTDLGYQINLKNFVRVYLFNTVYISFTILSFYAIYIIIKYRFFLNKLDSFPVFLLLVITYFICLYSIFKPCNNFFHYSILMWPFIFFFSALSIHHTKLITQRLWIAALIVLTPQLFQFKIRQVYPIHNLFKTEAQKPDEIIQSIYRYSTINDRIVVWGWVNKYYLLHDRYRGSGFLYPQFAMGKYNKEFALDMYLKHLIQFKPKIIVEAVGADMFYFSDYNTQSISVVSQALSDFFKKHYILVFRQGNTRVYQRLNH
ncbi:MAG: hypothetical protein ACK5JC_05970 [Bacteroidota bacterium]|jgi:uncharacterized membrane protein